MQGARLKPVKELQKDPTADHLFSDDRESKNISKVAGSHSVIMRPKKKGKFGPKLASGETGERHVPAAVQPLVDGMGKEREGQFDPLGPNSVKGNLALIGFGSKTGCLAERYIIIDSEVERKGSLALGNLLQQGAIKEVMLKLEEQFVEREVVFPVFARYVLARERLFETMIEDLLKYKDSRDYKPPLVLSAEVPRLRRIAQKRMGYLRATYHLFKDTVSETEKDNRALIKAHIKRCVKYYHALIPQLDLVELREGVNINHALSHDELGSPRAKRKNRQGRVT
jgi:hypothetical protein